MLCLLFTPEDESEGYWILTVVPMLPPFAISSQSRLSGIPRGYIFLAMGGRYAERCPCRPGNGLCPDLVGDASLIGSSRIAVAKFRLSQVGPAKLVVCLILGGKRWWEREYKFP